MRQQDFKSYLKSQGEDIGKYYINGKALGLNAVNDIVNWAKRVEVIFDVDLDEKVGSEEEIQSLVRKIQLSGEILDTKKIYYASAVKLYSEFANGYNLE
ncbi:hypothetical protein [Alkaliphilus transvaalensis]|uniref:hypothetical protein n=1 Tax=Alkaliphilus transvaalensis TaxID=114628 RepID=UPI00047C219E|nr:hypothetical protein [Alkaliphilus transvaalensis]